MILRNAHFSPCGTYRYWLARQWGAGSRLAVWVMLNPSTADAERDDPTNRRCMAFAQRWSMDGMVVVNLYAARATDPRDLMAMPDPVGPDNDETIRAQVQQAGDGYVICGWGANPMASATGRDEAVRRLIRHRAPQCLGTTKGDHPRHPLYLAYGTPLEVF